MYMKPFNDVLGMYDDDLNIYFMLSLYPNEKHQKILETQHISYDDLAYQIAEEDSHAKYLASLDAVQNLESTHDAHIEDKWYTIEKNNGNDSCINCAFNPNLYKRKHGMICSNIPPYCCALQEIYGKSCNINKAFYFFKEK